jgi:hypothetical protein
LVKRPEKIIDATVGNIIFSIRFQIIKVFDKPAANLDSLAYSDHFALISEGSLCTIPYAAVMGEDQQRGTETLMIHYKTIVSDSERVLQRCKRTQRIWISLSTGDAHGIAR